ncbi:MAG: carbohydrate-binding protein [Ruminococcus sp.]|nr:carbohydrate-binding protein [Ruminococcus sp.]
MKKNRKAPKALSLALSAALSLSLLPFVPVLTSDARTSDEYFLRGDVVGDDGITGVDAAAIQEYDAKARQLDDKQMLAADANADGKVSISDAVAILQWLVMYNYNSGTTGEYVPLSQEEYPDNDFSGNSSRYIETDIAGTYKLRIKYTNSTGADAEITVRTDEGYTTVTCPPTDGNEGELDIVIPVETAGTHSFSFESENAQVSTAKIIRTANLSDDFTKERTPIETKPQEQETTAAATTTAAPETTVVTTAPEVKNNNRYYAADAVIFEGVVENTNEGFEGAKGYANVDNKVGSSVEFTVDVAEDGNYKIDFRFANGTAASRPMQIVLNGSDDLYYVDFAGTGAWTTWDNEAVVLPLKAGKNTIKAVSTTETGGPNIDYIDVSKTGEKPIEPVKTMRFYAADAEYHKGWEETSNTGFEGKAYVNYDNSIGGYVEWTFEAPQDGNYEVDFRYANGTDVNRPIKLITNGDRTHGQYVDFKGTDAWTTWGDTKAVVSLKKGTNTLKAYATTNAGGPNMDYIEITQTGQSAPNAKATHGRQVEKLNRGVVMAHAKNGNLVSWRLLATDDENTTFDLWRIRDTGNVKLGTFTMDDASNYFDAEGTATDTYTVDVSVNGVSTEFAQASTNFTNTNSGVSGAYFDIQLKQPAGLTMPDGTTCTYSPNDCSVGDVDGDGQYELFVKWDPSNSQDNSKNGYTGNVYIDCYRLDGTMLWRVDLGKNIRAGAHYTQFMVYDFDGDGKAEMICKTADGTVDGTGKVVGDGSKDYRSDAGRILTGPEYLTLFDGATGKALDTVNYKPGRGNVGDWGDTYGNRVDRFTACVAYLDGKNAYACFGRGYYTRMAVTAYGVSGGKLKEYWAWDTGHNVSALGYGDGNHHCMGADVDQDGKDEVVCGSVIIDDNGQVLNTTSLAHGDAIHIGDFDPKNPGLEIFQCLEDDTHPNGTVVKCGVILRDAATAKVLFREQAIGADGKGVDTGRCLADNLITGNGGAEMVGSHNGVVYSATGDHEKVCDWSNITKWGQNSVVYWTDVLERAVLDRTMADQYGKGRVFTGDGVGYNNASKSNACITCDLMGDWREEMLFPCGTDKIRVFTTTYTTDYNIYSLMHNPQYRVQVASQNNGYNQPPHTDYYLDTTEYTRPEEPDVWTN